LPRRCATSRPGGGAAVGQSLQQPRPGLGVVDRHDEPLAVRAGDLDRSGTPRDVSSRLLDRVRALHP
jgi:hypothetical protein